MPAPTGRSNRLVIALSLLAIVALSVTATWVASSRIRSPAEVAARTLAPEPSPILVPVESRIISSDVVTRGTGRFGSPQVLAIVPTTLKATGAYVDSAPTVGTELRDGDVALVASGRPVFVVQGQQPAYRDLGPDMSGDDVRQLEQALDRLGFAPGVIDGVYDSATEQAITSWYQAAGYEPITTTVEQMATIRSLEGDVTSVERDALAGAEAVAVAQSEAAAAVDTVNDARSTSAAAEQNLLSIQAEAEAANQLARADVATAQSAVAAAFQKLPPPDDQSDDAQAAIQEWESLQIAVAAAEANAHAVRAAGQATIRAAELEVAAAPARISSAEVAAAAANRRVAIAIEHAKLSGASAPQLRAELETAQRRAGVQMPVDEIIFVAEAPVRVADVHVSRGDEAAGVLLSVTDAVVAVDGALALDQVQLVTEGMEVVISEPDLGIAATGVVNQVADGPGTRGADGFHVWFEVVVDGTVANASNIAGASVRLTLSVESSDGPVMAVPASALSLAADGSSQVLLDRGGTLVSVPVEPGLSASGYVTVISAGDELSEGDLVVVGFETRTVSSE